MIKDNKNKNKILNHHKKCQNLLKIYLNKIISKSKYIIIK